MAAVSNVPPPVQAVFFHWENQDAFIGTNLSRWAIYDKGQIRFDSGLLLEFAGSNPKVRIEGQEAAATRIHHFAGATRRSADTYKNVIYRDLYPGIDLVCRFSQSGFKSDFVVHPGADYSKIRMRYRGGIDPVTIGADRQLKIVMAEGELVERIPAIFQTKSGGEDVARSGGYAMHADGTVGFTIAGIDASLPTVIDPELVYSSYWSGSRYDTISAVAMAADDSVYIAGWTESTNLPVLGAYQATHRGSTDGFVAKLNVGGQTLAWATFYGGTGSDRITAMVLDSSLRPVIAGWTSSTNLPLLTPIQSTLRGSTDGFVARLAANGATLEFSTYYGGTGSDVINALAVDSSGIYLGGQTGSTDFPVVGAIYGTARGALDGTLTKLNANGTAAIYSTYIGGNNDDNVTGVAVLSQSVFVVGGTSSGNLPVLNGVGPRGGMDAFAMRFDTFGSSLLYSTYLGGSSTALGPQETATAIAVNSAGEAFIAGVTNSSNFPVVGAAQTALGGGGSDGFVLKLNSSGSASLWSTYLGGSSYDIVNAIVLRDSGQIAVTGTTGSFNFPVLNAVQPSHGGSYDAFITTYTSAGAMTFSTLWGGSGSDSANSIAAGSLSTNFLFIGGATSSGNLPILNGYQATAGDFANLNGFWANFIVAGGNGPKREQAGIFRFGGWALDKTGDFIWNTGDVAFSLGVSGDIPVIGDWDGTGRKRIGIFRNGVWYLDMNGDHVWTFGVDRYYYFGVGGDIPIVGDWAGIGKSCLGLYRGGLWVLDWNGNGSWDGGIDKVYAWGSAADIPVVGDWLGIGVSRAGLYNAGNWKLDRNGDWLFNLPTDAAFYFGSPEELPILADFSGVGVAQIYTYRPSTGIWRSFSGSLGSFGYPGDVPIVGPW